MKETTVEFVESLKVIINGSKRYTWEIDLK